jgi:flavin reductase
MNPRVSLATASNPAEPLSLAEFRDGMALLPGAVTVVTTDGPAGSAGFTASAVCSVTDSPPSLLVCMNRASFAHRFFTDNGVLCVNVLGGAQRDVAALFADRAVTMPDRFRRCPSRHLATGAPALVDALANLDGRIVATHAIGNHSVFIVELLRIQVHERVQALSGLAYFNRGYHALGQTAA